MAWILYGDMDQNSLNIALLGTTNDIAAAQTATTIKASLSFRLRHAHPPVHSRPSPRAHRHHGE